MQIYWIVFLTHSNTNKAFLSIEHETSTRGSFQFEFWYRDNQINLRDRDVNQKFSYGVETRDPKEVKRKNDADLTWVLLFGSIATVFLIVTGIIVCVRYCNQRKNLKKVEMERKQGSAIANWGVKTLNIPGLDKDSDEKDMSINKGLKSEDSRHNDRTDVNISQSSYLNSGKHKENQSELPGQGQSQGQHIPILGY